MPDDSLQQLALSLAGVKNKCVGLNQSLKNIREGKAELVYLADDAETRIKNQVHDVCAQMGVSVCPVPGMKELGQAVGINVGSAVVTVLKA